MVFLQLAERLHRRFLQHTLHPLRCLMSGDEHAVILGNLWPQPQAIAHHVGVGNGLQRFGGPDEHVATDDHRVESGRGHFHQLPVKRHLQAEQRLRQPLSSLPPQYGNGRENLTRWCISGQPTALSTGMDEQTAVGGQPRVESGGVGQSIFTRCLAESLEKQPGGAAAGA